MAGRPPASRTAIVEAAYAVAQRDGLAALSVRGVARECGIAVGTVYNYFPDKAALTTEVAAEFWERALANVERQVVETGGRGDAEADASFAQRRSLISYCRVLAAALSESLAAFRGSWLREISSLDVRSRQRSRGAELNCFERIRHAIAEEAERDLDIAPEARSRLGADALATYIWRSMFESMRAGDPSCETLLAVLELALYRDASV